MFGVPAPIVIVAGMLPVTCLVVRGSSLGIEATCGHPSAGGLFGVGIKVMIVAMIVATYVYTAARDSLSAVSVELDTIAAVVIGGTLLTGGQGSTVGTFIGVLIQASIQTDIKLVGTLSRCWTKIATGMLLFIGPQQGMLAFAINSRARQAGVAKP